MVLAKFRCVARASGAGRSHVERAHAQSSSPVCVPVSSLRFGRRSSFLVRCAGQRVQNAQTRERAQKCAAPKHVPPCRQATEDSAQPESCPRWMPRVYDARVGSHATCHVLAVAHCTIGGPSRWTVSRWGGPARECPPALLRRECESRKRARDVMRANGHRR